MAADAEACTRSPLILQRVPEEVAEQRRQRLREEARDRGRGPSEEALYLAGWLIVVTNVPCRRLSLEEVLVVLTVCWQIEFPVISAGVGPLVKDGRLPSLGGVVTVFHFPRKGGP